MNSIKAHLDKISANVFWIAGACIAGLGVFLENQIAPAALGGAVVGAGFMLCLMPAFLRVGGQASARVISSTQLWTMVSLGLIAAIAAAMLLSATTSTG
jgi:hypothetical protein